jgi:hypothetical protein
VAGPSELQHHMGLAFHDSGDRRVWQDTRRPWTAIIDIMTLAASFPPSGHGSRGEFLLPSCLRTSGS